MTTKTISGTYSAGYSLKSSFAAVTITSSGSVGGTGLVTTAFTNVINDGHLEASNGANGVTLGLGGGGLGNASSGYIRGGAAKAASGAGATGDAGGAGVYFTVYSPIGEHDDIYGHVLGGVGGAGVAGNYGAYGGAGGAGMVFHTGGYLRDGGLISGGAGGIGGANLTSSPYSHDEGGKGGYGVLMYGPGQVIDYHGQIYGGVGGRGANAPNYKSTGGWGGYGVFLAGGGYAKVYDIVRGGAGGYGYYLGGVGGTGVSVRGGAGTVVNFGAIIGGAGGAGADRFGANVAAGGRVGGDGVFLQSGGELVNQGTVRGGAGGSGIGAGVTGGAGGVGAELFDGGGTILNFGTVAGGTPGAGSSDSIGVAVTGPGVVVNGSATDKTAFIGSTPSYPNAVGVYTRASLQPSPVTVTNFGTISGFDAVQFGSSQDTLVVEAGCAFVGAIEGGGGTLVLASGIGTVGAFIGGGDSISVSGSMAPTTFSSFATLDIGGGASFTLAGGSELGADGSGVTIAQTGTLSVANGATVTALGTLTDNGVMGLDATTGPTWMEIDGKVFLQGSGDLMMSDHSGPGFDNAIIGATRSSTLENNSTISGTGYIGRHGQDGLVLANERSGTIDATGSGALILDASSGKGVTNRGLIEATGAGGVIVQYGTVTNATGTILAATGSVVTLLGADIVGGALQSAGSGQFVTSTGANILDGTTKSIKDAANVSLANGTTLTLEGAIANSGAIALNGSATNTDLVVGAAGVTLSGGGSILLGGQVADRIRGASVAASLDNTGDTISGAGLLGAGQLTLVNGAGGAIIGSSASAVLTIDTGANTIMNAELIEGAGKGTLIASALANTGTIAANGGTLTVEGAVTGAGMATINGGTLDLTSAFTENVKFIGGAGALELGLSQGYAGSITGFSKTGGTSLDLADIGFVSSTEATFSGTTTSGVLTVTDGSHTARITLMGNYTKSTFTASGDGHGGTIVIDPTANASAPSSPTTGSAHGFVIAMAALGDSVAGAPVHRQDAWRGPELALASPRIATA